MATEKNKAETKEETIDSNLETKAEETNTSNDEDKTEKKKKKRKSTDWVKERLDALYKNNKKKK